MQPVGDDLTLLVIKRVSSEAEAIVRGFVIPADLKQIKQLDAILDTGLGPWATDPALETWRHEFSLAFTEHISNILRHAYAHHAEGRVYGLISRSADRLTVETLDTGQPFDSPRFTPREPKEIATKELPESGYGLPLIRSVMDAVHYERRQPGRNYWRLSRRCPRNPV
jgi:anti-sigma regulatory factor (Ser/Thr protein kinase)